MNAPRLYADLAPLWPLLSPREDYAAEAAEIRGILELHLGPAAAKRPWRVMELGAGAGQSLSLLGEYVDALAVDVSAEMMQLCRRMHPRLRTRVGDMRDVRVDDRFDAVLAYDAIDYLVDGAGVTATCATAAHHLVSGGLFLAAPTYVQETFVEGDVVEDAHADAKREVAYVAHVARPDTGAETYELQMTILVREAGTLRVEFDRHRCGLFPTAQWERGLSDAGFEPLSLPTPEGDRPASMFLGIKR